LFGKNKDPPLDKIPTGNNNFISHRHGVPPIRNSEEANCLDRAKNGPYGELGQGNDLMSMTTLL